MKIQLSALHIALMVAFSAGAHAETPSNVIKVAPAPVIDGASAPSIVDAKARTTNPFTGNTKALEEGASQLALAKQRRSIAEQQLGEETALGQIEKLKRERNAPVLSGTPGMPTGSLQPVAKVTGFGLSPNQLVAKPQSIISSRQRPLILRNKDDIQPPGNVNASVGTPMLIGVTESGGHRYALFERNGRSVTVPENGSEGGIAVGAINGRTVVVNGVTQTIHVGQQEVGDVAEPVATMVVPNGNPAMVSRDMNALQLPTVPAQATLTGPQQFRN